MSSIYVFTRKCGSPETRIGGALIHRQQTIYRILYELNIRENHRSMYARVPHAMPQFVLKIAKLKVKNDDRS